MSVAGALPSLFIATGVAHAVVGVFLYSQPIGEMASIGFFNSIPVEWLTEPGSRIPRPQLDTGREAAFWFLLFSPILVLVGRVVQRALEQEDAVMLCTVGHYTMAIAAFGVIFKPLSPFLVVLCLGLLVRRCGKQLAG